ncbi:hypothetical protein M758_8G152200 [Ceratodon purpureus]|nr:hypothetical protein M758_8G152200 [Ceratodon purpureus]
MSDQLHSVDYESLLVDILGSDDDDLYRNQQCQLWNKNGSVLPEEGTSWPRSEDCVVMSIAETSVETQSDSDVDGVKVQGWGSDNKFRSTRMKRKQTGFLPEVQAPVNHARERQRGKNWEKMEEDILVESKGIDMDWKSISEFLKSKGFIRDHRHCSDKWYALRKHYIEIQQWMIQNPNTNYWDLTDSARIRTVPSSFCQRWYQVFDAACQKPETRKKVQQNLNPRRRPDSGQLRFAATDPSPSHSGPAMGGFALDSSPRFDPAFTTRPCCQPSVPLEGSQRYAGDRFYSGDAAYESERYEAADFLPNQGAVEYSNLPYSDIGVLWAEIRELSHTLRQKFAAEEEERIRNMEIKEKKLQLKIDRFQYKRQRDEEMRKRPVGLIPSSCCSEGL